MIFHDSTRSYAIGAYRCVERFSDLLTDPPGTTPCFGPRPNGSTSLPASGFQKLLRWRDFGGMLLVKAISAGQSRLRSRQEHPNRWIYLAYMYATMFCKMYMNRSGHVLCMV